MFTTHIENGEEEIAIDVEFDYEPFEPMERHYPGSAEAAHITEVTLAGTDIEICLLPNTTEEVETALLDWIHDEQDYAEYGYMMD